MAYSVFDLRGAIRAFGLIEHEADLFADVAPLEPTDFLRIWLDEFAPSVPVVNSEFARSALIVTPTLAEAARRAKGPAQVLPGLTLDVDRSRGLNGYCDFVLARSAERFTLHGPFAAVVEAKRDDILGGFGQCVASMVGIRDFNERDGTPLPAVYGAVTSGTNWRFLRLEGADLTFDRTEYYLRDAGKIVGILVHIYGG